MTESSSRYSNNNKDASAEATSIASSRQSPSTQTTQAFTGKSSDFANKDLSAKPGPVQASSSSVSETDYEPSSRSTFGTDSRNNGVRTWNGRMVNVAHRRTPSELTPLIQQNLALQQQVEMLQAQNQHMIAQQQMAQHMLPPQMGQIGQLGQMGQMGQVGQMAPPPMGLYMTPPMAQIAQMGPPPQLYPPPPFGSNGNHHSSGSNGGHMRQKSSQSNSGSGNSGQQGHARRHSLAVFEARRAAHERTASTGSFGGSGLTAANAAAGSVGSGANNADPSSGQNFRFPATNSHSPTSPAALGGSGGGERLTRSGHSRSASSTSSHGRRSTPSPSRFQFPPREGSAPTQSNSSSGGGHARTGSYHRRTSSRSFDFGRNSTGGYVETAQSSGGRKSLFVPYISQASVPQMVSEGLLVTGTLRVNHKNRSDAYVTTDVLDADVFICGSKDRNRALEGDLVAVELLDVDEVWDQKREKEEKKRRRDAQHSTEDSRIVETADGSLRRKGSLRQRAPQKRNDDVEVEGQTLLLREEFGAATAADQKPLYAGHIVAILERPAGQLFSGNLGLLRPSSQATKDRQQNMNGPQVVVDPPTHDRPKIVWFKPTDKCVPLMAIPTEQAPDDLVENPQKYADRIFVAQVKRWPITSLHPFGTIVEDLGPSNDPEVTMMAVLRDHNFGAHKFNEAAVQEVDDAVSAIGEYVSDKKSHTETVVFVNRDLALSQPQENVIRIHVVDITPFIRQGSLLDRELRHKSAGVYMKGLEGPLLPDACADKLGFAVGKTSPALAVDLTVNKSSGEILSTNVLKTTVIPSTANEKLNEFVKLAAKLRNKRGAVLDLDAVLEVCVPARPPLADASNVESAIEELAHQANAAIARKLLAEFGSQSLIRWQPEPQVARVEELASLLRSVADGRNIDTSTSQALSRTIASFEPRQTTALKAAIAKLLPSQKYSIASRVNPADIGHYWLGFPVYTHFSAPLRRYADHVVHRQLHQLLNGNETAGEEENRQLVGLSAELSFRYDCARAAQEQSFHLRVSRDSLSEVYRLFQGVVIAVYESAFDVVIPELSIEKRVHGDQLPLSKAEFHPEDHMLELFWNGSADSATFAPENAPAADTQNLSTLEIASQNSDIDLNKMLSALKPQLRTAEFVQEIRPLLEVPVLIRVDAGGRILPSITVRAVNPFINSTEREGKN